MKNEELHPVRFSRGEIEFIEFMIYASGPLDQRERDILSTIEKSEKRDRKPLTEGKMLSNVKDGPATGPPSDPPGQGKPRAKKCRHLNIRFTGMGPDYCPDCHTNVWLSDMINILLDLLHVHPIH